MCNVQVYIVVFKKKIQNTMTLWSIYTHEIYVSMGIKQESM